MRVSVDHRTRYHFTEPQARLIQLLRLTPQDSTDQTVVHWHIGVARDARLREARDGYGNRVTMLYAAGPLTDIEITVQGEVLTAGDTGLVRGVAEPLPPALFARPRRGRCASAPGGRKATGSAGSTRSTARCRSGSRSPRTITTPGRPRRPRSCATRLRHATSPTC